MTCFRATQGHNARNICSQFAFQSINSPALPVQKFRMFLVTVAEDRSRDPLAGALFQPDISHPITSDACGEPLSHWALGTLALYYTEHFPNQAFPSCMSYAKYTSGKVTLTTYISSPHDCNIAFISNNTQWPGGVGHKRDADYSKCLFSNSVSFIFSWFHWTYIWVGV